MPQSLKVSIIIPVYNAERFIADCMNSVLAQDYDNIEIIAVNDGSTDNTPDLLAQFRLDHPSRITVITTPNCGVSVARNRGLDAATGDYVLFVDDDDWIEPDTVSRCMAHITSRQLDMVLFSGTPFLDGLDPADEPPYCYERRRELLNQRITAADYFVRASQLGNHLVVCYLYLFRRDMVRTIRFPEGIIHEDNVFTTRLLVENPESMVMCAGDWLYHRRHRPGSLMTQKKQIAHITGYIAASSILFRLKAAQDSSTTATTLNNFAKRMLKDAIYDCGTLHGKAVPWHIRKRLMALMLAMPRRALNPKTILVCIFPEILLLRKVAATQAARSA